MTILHGIASCDSGCRIEQLLAREDAVLFRGLHQWECRIVANTSAFQAEDVGSIPVIPSHRPHLFGLKIGACVLPPWRNW